LLSLHREPFNDWLRQLVTLSSGALTLLVGLQSHYIPQHPTALWLLRLCWGSLAIAVLAGVVALRGEWQTPLDAYSALRRMRAIHGDAAAAADLMADSGHSPRPVFDLAVRACFWCFVFSVLTLAVFAILNVATPPMPTAKS
jgi:hypothetical protein